MSIFQPTLVHNIANKMPQFRKPLLKTELFTESLNVGNPYLMTEAGVSRIVAWRGTLITCRDLSISF